MPLAAANPDTGELLDRLKAQSTERASRRKIIRGDECFTGLCRAHLDSVADERLADPAPASVGDDIQFP